METNLEGKKCLIFFGRIYEIAAIVQPTYQKHNMVVGTLPKLLHEKLQEDNIKYVNEHVSIGW